MKKKKINPTVVFGLIIYLLIFFILIILYGNGASFTGKLELTKKLAYIETSIFLLGVILAFIAKIKFTSIGIMYYTFFYIFLFGQVNCRYIFNFKDSDLFDMTNYITVIQIQKGILLSTYAMIGIYIGILISNLFKIKEKEEKIINETKIENDTLRLVSKILLVISFPFICIYLIKNLSYAFSGGYVEAYTNVTYGVASLMDKIKPFFTIGLLGILYSSKNNKKNFIKIYIGIIIYSGIEMMIGARGLPLLQLVSASLIYNYVYGFTKKQILMVVLAIIPISIVIAMLRITRDTGMNEWINDIPFFINMVLEKDPILTTINEMGTAIYPTALSIDIFPDKLPFKYGNTFLYALSEIIPNLSGGVHNARLLANVNIEVGKYTGIAFGGSIVQEMYANFSFWGVPIALAFLSTSVSIIEKKVLAKNTNSISKVLWFAFIIQFLWTVRNNLAPLIRYSTWYLLTTYVLYNMIVAQKRRKEKWKK